jgi:histidinol dehydrogenase
MKLLVNPSPEKWQKHLARPAMQTQKINQIVKPIFEKVKKSGDKALKKFAKEFDQVRLDSLLVSAEEIQTAIQLVPDNLKKAIALAKANIEKFHAAQASPELIIEVMPGVTCSRKSVPIQRVGLYIPGGTAPLFSTVLMLGVPAKLAGCKEIVLCTPTNREGAIHPAILYTAQLIGIESLPRKDIASKALANSCAVILEDQATAIALINDYAPEHLILAVAKEEEVLSQIYNAGSVFIGNFTPEAAGDYASGTNHTLPTYGYARNYSGVSLDSFVKKITYQKITPKGLKSLGPAVEIMAENEQLHAHKNAVTLRLNSLKTKKK